MQYACEEARRQADKGARSACIDDETVYGWAIHYFEEDSIEGTLFHEDGTEYKKQPSAIAKAPTVKYTPPKSQPKPQMSFFELFENRNMQQQKDLCKNSVEDDEEPTEEEILEAVEQNEGVSTLCADPETGEVLTEEEMREFDGDIEEPDMDEIDSSAFDVEALAILDEIFGNELEVR